MTFSKLFRIVLASAALQNTAVAQTLSQEMPALAARLNAALLAGKYKAVAAIDFTDLQGRPTELGRQLSERLVVELVLTGGVSMADRANIKSILAEHRLTEEGLVNAANAKKLGEFANVDAILTGMVYPGENGWELTVKAIATESARIVAAGRIAFPRTSDNQQAGSRAVGSGERNSNGASKFAAGRGSGAYSETKPIVSRDIGSIRLSLMSVSQTKE